MTQRQFEKEALKKYARFQIRHPDNTMSPEQWVALLNCYLKREPLLQCAEKARISEAQAAMWYCHFSLAVSAYAIRQTRRKYRA